MRSRSARLKLQAPGQRLPALPLGLGCLPNRGRSNRRTPRALADASCCLLSSCSTATTSFQRSSAQHGFGQAGSMVSSEPAARPRLLNIAYIDQPRATTYQPSPDHAGRQHPAQRFTPLRNSGGVRCASHPEVGPPDALLPRLPMPRETGHLTTTVARPAQSTAQLRRLPRLQCITDQN